VVILDSGRIAAEGTPLPLNNTIQAISSRSTGPKDAVKALSCPYEAICDAYRVAVPDTAAATKLIAQSPELFQDYEITNDVFLTGGVE